MCMSTVKVVAWSALAAQCGDGHSGLHTCTLAHLHNAQCDGHTPGVALSSSLFGSTSNQSPLHFSH